MDQMKIGRFIAEKRKGQNLTQAQLAEKLGITDRAVSKWETGRSLPDASCMIELCGLLKITVNDLLSGEVVSMENYQVSLEKNLIDAVSRKEQSDRRLLNMEVVTGIISSVFLVAMVLIGSLLMKMELPVWVFILLVGVGFLQFVLCMVFCLRVEQVAGYYECRKCGHRYVPSYREVSMSMHMGRTRYMRCPECGKRSWQKKVVSGEAQK